MFSRNINAFIVFIFSLILTQQVQATTPQSIILGEDKDNVERNILSFLDPNSLGRLTYTTKGFKESVDKMDYFIENKKFLKTIFKINRVLAKIEVLRQNIRENKKGYLDEIKNLASLLKELYPHAQLGSQRIFTVEGKPSEPLLFSFPVYDPEFYGNNARDRALAKTIEDKQQKLQELFIHLFKFLGPHYRLISNPVFDDLKKIEDMIYTSALADFEKIKAGIIHEDSLRDKALDIRKWIRNPNPPDQEFNEFIGNLNDEVLRIISGERRTWIFSNPVCPETTIESYFDRLLERAERDEEGETESSFQERQFAFATGVALNPVAISKFGTRLLSWLIQNEEMVLIAENGFYFNSYVHYLPLSSLMFNSNLSKTTSEEIADYLLLSLKQLTVAPTPVKHYTSWASFSKFWPENNILKPRFCKKNTFRRFITDFAMTAHGSEVILEKLDTILGETFFSLEYKKDLIYSLFKGFEWAYYFKNYSIDHDVKRPGPIPEKPTLAILEWFSEIPQESIPFEILEQLVSRGGLSSQAIDQAMDIIVKNLNPEFKTQMLIKLIEESRLYAGHYQRIIQISETFSDEWKQQIQEAIAFKNWGKEKKAKRPKLSLIRPKEAS